MLSQEDVASERVQKAGAGVYSRQFLDRSLGPVVQPHWTNASFTSRMFQVPAPTEVSGALTRKRLLWP